MLAQVRKEYEMLRIEFEQNLAANEQTGPINREMRHLITSLQNHIQQLKGEIIRYKRKYKEASTEVSKVMIGFALIRLIIHHNFSYIFQLKKDLDEAQQKLAQRARSVSVGERQDSVSSEKGESKDQVIKEESNESSDSAVAGGSGDTPAGDDHKDQKEDIKKEENEDEIKVLLKNYFFSLRRDQEWVLRFCLSNFRVMKMVTRKTSKKKSRKKSKLKTKKQQNKLLLKQPKKQRRTKS